MRGVNDKMRGRRFGGPPETFHVILNESSWRSFFEKRKRGSERCSVTMKQSMEINGLTTFLEIVYQIPENNIATNSKLTETRCVERSSIFLLIYIDTRKGDIYNIVEYA